MDSRNDYVKGIATHYSRCWSATSMLRTWNLGPVEELPDGFAVLQFSPTATRDMWTYATRGMSLSSDAHPLELHLFSPTATESLVELLTVIAHYHRTGSPLALGHSVNFGRPWLPHSACEFGLVSLPYLDGPSLEWGRIEGHQVRFLWLIPITQQEKEYKKEHGLEALEKRLESSGFNYVDPNRASVV